MEANAIDLEDVADPSVDVIKPKKIREDWISSYHKYEDWLFSQSPNKPLPKKTASNFFEDPQWNFYPKLKTSLSVEDASFEEGGAASSGGESEAEAPPPPKRRGVRIAGEEAAPPPPPASVRRPPRASFVPFVGVNSDDARNINFERGGRGRGRAAVAAALALSARRSELKPAEEAAALLSSSPNVSERARGAQIKAETAATKIQSAVRAVSQRRSIRSAAAVADEDGGAAAAGGGGSVAAGGGRAAAGRTPAAARRSAAKTPATTRRELLAQFQSPKGAHLTEAEVEEALSKLEQLEVRSAAKKVGSAVKTNYSVRKEAKQRTLDELILDLRQQIIDEIDNPAPAPRVPLVDDALDAVGNAVYRAWNLIGWRAKPKTVAAHVVQAVSPGKAPPPALVERVSAAVAEAAVDHEVEDQVAAVRAEARGYLSDEQVVRAVKLRSPEKLKRDPELDRRITEALNKEKLKAAAASLDKNRLNKVITEVYGRGKLTEDQRKRIFNRYWKK
jgi:hypothetical protein